MGGQASEQASSMFTTAPHCSPYYLRSISCQISTELDSHKSANPTALESSPNYSPYPSLEKIFSMKPVQFSHSVMSDSFQTHELQHTRPPCPSPTPGVDSNSCPSSRWCHPAISSSVVPSSSCPQSLPASGTFPVSQLFAWGGQSTGVSASASVLPMSTQDWSLGWTGWVSLQFKGLSASTWCQKDWGLLL